jgi:hypothetical protein
VLYSPSVLEAGNYSTAALWLAASNGGSGADAALGS